MYATRVRAAFVLALLVAPPDASRQDSGCDPGIVRLASGPHGYNAIGDRCEGMYARQVAEGDVLTIASLTDAFDDFNSDIIDTLTVQWAASTTRPVFIRASGIRPRLYYRMDKAVRAQVDAYRWPTNVLASEHIQRADLGVLAWTVDSALGADNPLYVPVVISGHPTGKPREKTLLVVVPSARLKELYVTVGLGQTVRHAEPLDLGPYQADVPIVIPIDVAAPGRYHVAVAARVWSGGSDAIDVWIQRAAQRP